jgi:uncharacterized protein (UPF0147 family)
MKVISEIELNFGITLDGISKTRDEDLMQDELIPANLRKRLEELKEREASYWEDELYSVEALTNLAYRQELEKSFNLDPLGPLPPRQ